MYLGIDIGTSGVKAVLLDGEGRDRGQAGPRLTCSRQHPLWSEQKPDDWWRATEAAVLGLDPALRAQVQGIGLGGTDARRDLARSGRPPAAPGDIVE